MPVLQGGWSEEMTDVSEWEKDELKDEVEVPRLSLEDWSCVDVKTSRRE